MMQPGVGCVNSLALLMQWRPNYERIKYKNCGLIIKKIKNSGVAQRSIKTFLNLSSEFGCVILFYQI